MSTLATQLVHVSKKRGRSMGISVKVIYKLGGSYGYQSLYTSLCESQTHGKHKHMGIHTYTHASTHTHTHTLKSDTGTLGRKWGGDSSAGRVSNTKTRRNTNVSSSPRYSKGFFPQESSFSADSLTVSAQPHCAIAYINISVHVKSPKHRQPYHCLDTRKYCTH